jgi:hypothetical protein
VPRIYLRTQHIKALGDAGHSFSMARAVCAAPRAVSIQVPDRRLSTQVALILERAPR